MRLCTSGTETRQAADFTASNLGSVSDIACISPCKYTLHQLGRQDLLTSTKTAAEKLKGKGKGKGYTAISASEGS
jgi:hypothetical protein